MAGLIRGNRVNLPGVTIGGGVDGTGDEYLGTIGPTGPSGVAGATGATGPQGLQGSQGSQGPQGLTGSQGVAGATGATGPTGPQGLQGVGGAAGSVIISSDVEPVPTTPNGNNGDYWFVTTTRALWGPKVGGLWPTTSTSLSGRILSGSGAPGGTGANGDWYFDTTAKAMYGPKASNLWPTAVSLVGAAGTAGATGPQGLQGVAGRVILSGTASPPASSTGSDGDYYFNTSTRALSGPKASGTWPTAISLSGKILSGSGAPGSITSIDGDWYFDTTAKAMYGPKASGAWPAAVPLVANTLLNGIVPPLNTTGTDGDFYYNTTDKLFYGPKASNTWPAGASMQGPTGPAGPVSAGTNPSMFIQVAVSDETTPLTTGDKLTFRVAYAFTLTEIRASLTTAVSGSSLKIDVKKGGTSIFSSNSLLTIDDGSKTSVNSTAAYAISSGSVSIADDSEFTISVTQIGSATAGAGLKLTFKGDYA